MKVLSVMKEANLPRRGHEAPIVRPSHKKGSPCTGAEQWLHLVYTLPCVALRRLLMPADTLGYNSGSFTVAKCNFKIQHLLAVLNPNEKMLHQPLSSA